MSRSKTTVPVNIFLFNPHERPDQWLYMVHYSKDCPQGWYLVETFEHTITPPKPQDVVPVVVAAMREKQTEIRAKAESESKKIDEAINNMLTLGYAAAPKVVDDIPF